MKNQKPTYTIIKPGKKKEKEIIDLSSLTQTESDQIKSLEFELENCTQVNKCDFSSLCGQVEEWIKQYSGRLALENNGINNPEIHNTPYYKIVMDLMRKYWARYRAREIPYNNF